MTVAVTMTIGKVMSLKSILSPNPELACRLPIRSIHHGRIHQLRRVLLSPIPIGQTGPRANLIHVLGMKSREQNSGPEFRVFFFEQTHDSQPARH
jgi:hypothetical protein